MKSSLAVLGVLSIWLCLAGCNSDAQRQQKRDEDRMAMKIIDAERQRDQYKSRCQALEASVTEAQTKQAVAQHQLDTAQVQLKTAQFELSQAQARLATSEQASAQKLATANDALKKAQDRVAELTSQLQGTQDRIAKLTQ